MQMGSLQLPFELHRHIIDLVDWDVLGTARLVDRAWNFAASRRLLHTFEFLPTQHGLYRWKSLLSAEKLRRYTRKIIVNSNPKPYESVRYEDWELIRDWSPGSIFEIMQDQQQEGQIADDSSTNGYAQDQGRWMSLYRDFYHGLAAISKFPSIENVLIRFLHGCQGDDAEFEPNIGTWEGAIYRDDIMRRICDALAERQRTGMSQVRVLEIENLENRPSNLAFEENFISIMKDVEQLILNVTERCSEPGFDYDFDAKERRTFIPHLEKAWLLPISIHLKSLSLTFLHCWGAVPGRFDGSSLEFSCLEHITLKRYSLAHDDSLDWVLKQKSLRSLRLEDCSIASYLKFLDEELREWEILLHDWEKLSGPSIRHAAVGPAQGSLFHYPGTWADFFEKIGNGLPLLENFGFMFCESFMQRYKVLDTFHTGFAWEDPDKDGQFSLFEAFDDEHRRVNRHLDTDSEDRRALEELTNMTINHRLRRL